MFVSHMETEVIFPQEVMFLFVLCFHTIGDLIMPKNSLSRIVIFCLSFMTSTAQKSVPYKKDATFE